MQKTDLCAAHEVLLVCIARSLTHMLLTMYHAQYNTQSVWVQHIACHMQVLTGSLNKNWRTHACLAHASVNLEVSCAVPVVSYTLEHISEITGWKNFWHINYIRTYVYPFPICFAMRVILDWNKVCVCIHRYIKTQRNGLKDQEPKKHHVRT